MEQNIWLVLIIVVIFAIVGGLVWLGSVVAKAIKSRRGKQ